MKKTCEFLKKTHPLSPPLHTDPLNESSCFCSEYSSYIKASLLSECERGLPWSQH